MKSTTPATPAGLGTNDLTGGPADPLDDILRQIIGGYFVLTDGQGSVSKWSEPAELLFGRPAAEVLGQSFFQTLIKPPVPAAAESWRRFLEAGEAPTEAGRVEVTGAGVDGGDFPMEAVFVPVKLDEGFDFSLFLEDLGFELPMNLMLQRMRAQHPVVVRAMRQALEPEPQPWEGWRTAGTLVVFRPLKATPWVEAELARREAARAEADAEVEERLTNLDPGIQGNSVADLDDAAAVVARLLSAMERIDELERVALGLPGQLEEARQSAERRAEAAEREAAALRAEVQRALAAGGGGDDKELLARLERLERAKLDAEQATYDRNRALDVAEAARAELAARLDRLERQRAESSAAADARLATAVAEAQRSAEEALAEARRRADESRTTVEARLAEIEKGRSGASEVRQTELVTQLEQVRAEHEEAAQAARAELAATLDRLERDRAREAEASRAELAAALQRVEQVQREADALREQLTSVTVEHAEAGDDRRRLDDLARDAEASRARIDGLRDELASAADVAGLREEIAALRTGAAELETLRAQLGALQAGASEIETLRSQLDAVQAGAGDLERFRSELTNLQASAADLMALRGQVETLRGGLPDLEPLRARLDELQARVDAPRATDDLDGLRAELASVRESAAALPAVREELAALRASADELETLRRDHGAALARLEELRAQQEQVRTWLDEARRERDEFRAAGERTVAQVEELRRSLEERESAPAIPAEQAVERDVVDAMGGEVDALRNAEQALRMRLAELTAAGEATTRRIDELADAERVVGARLEQLTAAADNVREDALARVAEVAAANDATVRRLDEVAAASERLDEVAAANERRLDEMAAAVEAVRAAEADPRIDQALAGAGEAAARVEELAAAVEAVRAAEADPRIDDAVAAAARAEALAADGAKAGRDAASNIEELQERLDAVDRGAGGVLSDVRALRDRLDEVSTVARAAQEAASGGHPELEELRAAVARLGGEVEAARSQVEHARQEALGAREQAAATGEAVAAARDDAAAARDEAVALRRELTAADERQAALATDVERAAGSAATATTAAEAAKADAAAAKSAGEKSTQQLTDLDAKAQALRTEMTAGRERLEAIGERVERLGKDVVESGQTAGAAIEAQGAELRTELAAVRRIAEEARDGIETLRAEMDSVRDASLSVRDDAAAARSASEAGDRKVEAMQAELTFALKQLEDVKAGLTSAGQAAVIARREAEQAKRAVQQSAADSNSGVTEVFQQLLAAARGDGPPAGAQRSGLRRPQTPAQDLKRKSEITARPAAPRLRRRVEPDGYPRSRRPVPRAEPCVCKTGGVPGERVREGLLAVAARPRRVPAAAGAAAPACIGGDRFSGRTEHLHAWPGPDGPRRRDPQGRPR